MALSNASGTLLDRGSGKEHKTTLNTFMILNFTKLSCEDATRCLLDTKERKVGS